ncbi:MAG TPA: UDP-N-acetylglucosamine 2-epimerase (non-hydrolyzing), partial [Gaiellaceae bacterium]
VVGNRPQFVKSAPLSAALRAGGIDEVVLHTGQHYDRALSGVFFDELGLGEPGYRLGLESSDPAAMVPGIRAAVEAERPDWVVVLGDTNSTLAGAQAAGETPVAHIEAGLRSFDLSMPEERNRIAVDRVSALLLCPDERSAAQLRSEQAGGRIEVVGDVMADATRLFSSIARERSKVLARLGAKPRGYVLLTIHREANVEPTRLAQILAGTHGIGRTIFPVHPRTRRVIEEGRIELPAEIELIDPLGYLDFTALAESAAAILTDSGGLQKEAYWHRVPCVTVRPSTEWIDTVEAGANSLVEPDGIAGAVASAIARGFPENAPALYGDGHAAERIAAALYPSVP